MARVLVIADTHCPAMHPEYPDHLEEVRDAWKCDTVVHVGDLADWGAISFHERHPAHPSAEREIEEARIQIAELKKRFPEVTVLVGNHDALPERQAKVAGIPSDMLVHHAKVWDTPDWKYVPRFGSVSIDGVLYQHGDRGKMGVNAARNNAIENFSSVVQGHLHTQAGVAWMANNRARCFGMQVGCGIDIDKLTFEYGRKFNGRPLLACGVVVDGDGAYVEMMDL